MGNSPHLFHFLAVLIVRSLLGSPYKGLRCWQLLSALQQTPRATSEVPRAMRQVPGCPYKVASKRPLGGQRENPGPEPAAGDGHAPVRELGRAGKRRGGQTDGPPASRAVPRRN